MTITGGMNFRQRTSIRLRSVLVCLLFAGVGSWFFTRSRFRIEGFFSIMGAVAFGLLYWSDRRTVVAFTCEDEYLVFRRLGKSHAEKRALADLVRVRDISNLCRMHTGCELAFRDGAEAYVPDRLPGAAALVRRLRGQMSPRS